MKLHIQIALFVALCWAVALPLAAQDMTALEQRTESLRAQLRDVSDKEAALQARMQQLDEDLKPENIRNRTALTGTLDADKLRDQVRQQLEGEKARAQQQLDLLATSRAHLESSIAEAEAAAVKRRAAALAPSPTAPVETQAPTVAPMPKPSAAGQRRRNARSRRHRPTRASRRT